jgi:hypothetical protein
MNDTGIPEIFCEKHHIPDSTCLVNLSQVKEKQRNKNLTYLIELHNDNKIIYVEKNVKKR